MPDDEEVKEIAADLMEQGIIDESELDCTRPAYVDEEYPAWSRENSFVVSGPLGQAKYPGSRYEKWQHAEHAARNRYQVFKFWVFGNRWYARVRKNAYTV